MKARHVLIIDDDENSLLSLAKLLEYFGHVVETAVNGKQGIEKARQHKPDVVLCDIEMPGEIDGLEVARALTGDAGANVPVLIAVSGYGNEDDVEKCHEAGFQHHLLKPVDGITLAKSVSGLFGTEVSQPMSG
jgi:CheY-like chemotaxis protein